MEFVPAKDSVHQWETLYERMSNTNKTSNINEIDIEKASVTGIPPSVTDLEGNLIVPKEASNVKPPRPETPPLSPLYKETSQLGTQERLEEEEDMKRRRMSTAPRRKQSRPVKRRKKTTQCKRAPVKKRTVKRGRGRSRSKITR